MLVIELDTVAIVHHISSHILDTLRSCVEVFNYSRISLLSKSVSCLPDNLSRLSGVSTVLKIIELKLSKFVAERRTKVRPLEQFPVL